MRKVARTQVFPALYTPRPESNRSLTRCTPSPAAASPSLTLRAHGRALSRHRVPAYLAPAHFAPVPPPSRLCLAPVSPAAPVAPLHLCGFRGPTGRKVKWVAPKAPRSLRARLVEVSDETAERVARDELLALELDARRRRSVVGLEPLLDSAALVRMAVYLFCVPEGRCRSTVSWCGVEGRAWRMQEGPKGLPEGERGAPC
eukprot:scaffold48181_cov63-Phaeocystis_antarctica.AAC.3